MSFKRKVRLVGEDLYAELVHQMELHGEKQKFKDPRRKAIYNTVTLSREQEDQIDRLYMENYGRKIPYTWHRHFTAFTGQFDPQYFPELLYIPEFEHYMNLDRSYTDAFADKNLLPLIAVRGGYWFPKYMYPQRVASCATAKINH